MSTLLSYLRPLTSPQKTGHDVDQPTSQPTHDDDDGDRGHHLGPNAPQVLSLHHDRNHLGFSLYDSLTGTLHLGASDDLDLPPHHDRVHALLAMYLPSVVLISCRSPLRAVLAASSAASANDGAGGGTPLVVDERPAQDFAYPNARAKLTEVVSALTKAAMVRTSNAHNHLDTLLGGDSKSNVLSVCSAGALCRFLDALRSVQHHHHGSAFSAKGDPDSVHWGTRSNLASSSSTPPPPPTSRATHAAASTTLSRHRPHPLAVDDPYLDSMSVAGTVHTRPPLTSASSATGRDPAATTYDFSIHHITLTTPSDTLHMSASTQSALQLFDTPVSASPSTGSSEFTCVMSVLDTTRSADGKWRLRQWMARPLAHAPEINARHDAVAYLAAPASASLVRHVRGQLVHVKALGKVLSKPVLAPADWRAVVGTLRAGVAIVDAVSEAAAAAAAEGTQGFPELLRGLVAGGAGAGAADDLTGAATRATCLVDQVLDLDASVRDQRCVVQVGVDAALDDLKRQFDQLPDLLAEVAADVATQLPRELQSHVNVVYLPQIGYLVLLPRGVLDDFLGPLVPLDTYAVAGLELQFSTPAYGYFKSPRMRDLDAALGDIYGMITDRELEIVFVLREAVKELDPLLRVLHSHLVTLDVLVSLAEAATRFGYSRPQMVPAGHGLVAAEVRHPLLERIRGSGSGAGGASKAYIPNQVDLGGQDGVRRTWVLTGANASGKSVYLKSVALLVYLAHIGSFVPAAPGARVPLTDAILSRMAAGDSVSQAQSAFLHDVQQIAHIVRCATPRSLVVIDEFGKGTSTADGIGLFVGVIEYLANGAGAAYWGSSSGAASRVNGTLCGSGGAGPLVIAATHFHDILTHNLLPPSLPIGTLSTQILLHPTSPSPAQNPHVVFLYRVTQGTCTTSYAGHCAAIARVPRHIIQRGTLAAQAIGSGEGLTRVAEEFCCECEQRLEEIVGEYLATDLDAEERRGIRVGEVVDRVEVRMGRRQDGEVFAMLVGEEEEQEEDV